MNQVIYLCGPMTGLTPEQASKWRADAEATLAPFGFVIASPMRVEGKLLAPGKKIKAVEETNIPAMQGAAIYWRDMYDLDNTDILLCNLNDVPDGPCIGSIFEIGYVAGQRKAAILIVARPETLFRQHPMMTTPAHAVFDELEEAYEFIKLNYSIFNTEGYQPKAYNVGVEHPIRGY